MDKVKVYDTTLRDGMQAEGISFSIEDKILVARKLDEFGADYIEGGFPLSNPKEEQFFARMAEVELKTAKLVAFGSTRRAGCLGSGLPARHTRLGRPRRSRRKQEEPDDAEGQKNGERPHVHAIGSQE